MPSAVHVLSERRAAPRFPVDHGVDVQSADGHWSRGRLLDVSVDGARIGDIDARPQGLLRLRLATNLGDVEILARGVRVTSDGVAVEFVEMTIEALTRYSRWLDQLVSTTTAGAVSASS